MVSLSVVIPAFNEAHRLPRTLTEILGLLAPGGREFEIIVVDDGSTDTTAEVARGFTDIDRRVNLLPLPRNRGKGNAVRSGVLACDGEMVLVVDADGATPFGELKKLEAALDAGADIAIGTRAAKAGEQHVKALWYRKLLGTVFNGIVHVVTVKGFTDTQCGFKLFRRVPALQVFSRQRLDGFCFDVEILLLALRRGFRVTEVAVDWADQPGGKVNLLIDPLKMLRDLALIRWWTLTRVYEAPAPEGPLKVEEPAPGAPLQS